jgi:sugar phosphate isomerase/epimerase
MNRLKLGVAAEPFGVPFRQAAAAAAKLGCHGLAVDATGELAPDRLGDTARREIRTLLKGYSLELAAVRVPLRRGLDVTEDQQARLEYVTKAMRLAVDLGPRLVTVPCPAIPAGVSSVAGVTDPGSTAGVSDPGYRKKADTLRDALAALASAGDRLGVHVCLEAGLDTAEALGDYLGTFDTGFLGVAFDPVNFLANGHKPLESLAKLIGRVRVIHARDARASAGGPREVAVGAGDVDWTTLVATLDAGGYSGFLVVDRQTGDNRPGDLAVGVKFLRRFLPPTEANFP